jgi:hypothetical protein
MRPFGLRTDRQVRTLTDRVRATRAGGGRDRPDLIEVNVASSYAKSARTAMPDTQKPDAAVTGKLMAALAG